MKRSEYRITLELGGSHGACRLDMKRSDTYRRIHIDFTDGGKPYRVSENCSAVFLAKKPSGTVIYNECTIREGAVEYDVTPQTTAEPGILHCEVRLYDTRVTLQPDEYGKLYLPEEDVHLLTSCTFTICVHDTVYNGQVWVNSLNEVTKLDALVTEAAAAIADARAIREARDAGAFDGVSVTHSWSGANLVLTSGSGTTSTNLLGPAGPRGEKGDKGDRGEPGYPVDDVNVSENPWSSQRILQAFCPRFSLGGWLISCHPVVGDRLELEADYGDGILTVTGCGKNLYDSKTYGLNTEGYIYEATGNTSNSGNYRRTDYIPVSHLQGQTINLNNAPVDSSYPGMAFYDENKQFISGGKGNAITVPQNARYMRFSVHVDHLERVQLELGTVATPYEAYKSQTWEVDIYAEGCMFSVVPGKALCHFFAYQNQRASYLLAQGRSDPLPLLEKLAKEANYV